MIMTSAPMPEFQDRASFRKRLLWQIAMITLGAVLISIAMTAFMIWDVPPRFFMTGMINASVIPAVAAPLTLSVVYRLQMKNHNLLLENRRLAEEDDLTGLFNRRAFLERAGKAMQRMDASGPIALHMIDVDHFKQINDTYGHQTGDGAIASIAEVLARSAPDEAIVARLGGEEFVVLTSAGNAGEAGVQAELMRRAVERSSSYHGEDELKMTVSIGVVMTDKPVAISELLSAADKALYKSKGSGRNRSSIAARKRSIGITQRSQIAAYCPGHAVFQGVRRQSVANRNFRKIGK